MADIYNQPVPTKPGQSAPVPNGVRAHSGEATIQDITTSEDGRTLNLSAPRRAK